MKAHFWSEMMKLLSLLFTLSLAIILLAACGQLDIAVVDEARSATSDGSSSATKDPADRTNQTATATPSSDIDNTRLATRTPTPLAEPGETSTAVSEVTPTDEPDDAPIRTQTPTPNRTPVPEVDGCDVRTDWPLYSVKRGDTLGRIARDVGTTVDELVRANCLENPDRLFSGQSLRVPVIPSDPPTPTPTPEAWAHHDDPLYQIGFDYPDDWRDVSDGLMVEFAGEDGFVRLAAVGATSDLDTVAADEAFHVLQPYGSSPDIENFTLADGRQGRLILPSADQGPSMERQAMIVTPYAEPIPIGDNRFNYLMLAADSDHIRDIGASLTLPPPTGDIGIDNFSVEAEDLTSGGKRLTFRWSSHGAIRGTITSGTAERFVPWWPVESVGELIVDVATTVFADPVMTLRVVNDVTGQEAFATDVVPWPCEFDYFFEPGLRRCPRSAPLTVDGAFQPFEGGFMVWLPRPDLPQPSIYVFDDDGQLSLYPDTWSEDDPTNGSGTEPPDGLFPPVGGFGKIWRENPLVRDQLGWGTAEEALYSVTYQAVMRESIPGIAYLTLPDGTIVRLLDTSWQEFVPGQDTSGQPGLTP